MNDKPARRGPTWIPRLLIAYGLGVSAWVVARWLMTGGHANAPGWLLLLPVQAFTIVQVIRSLARVRHDATRRLGWRLLLGAFVVDTAAILAWNYIYHHGNLTPFGTLADILYLINYALLAAACGAFYICCGGTFRSSRVWLDFATLGLASAAGLIPFLVHPLLKDNAATLGDVLATTGYMLGIITSGTAALVLSMQLSEWRQERPFLLIIVGIAIELAADLYSVSMNERGEFALANIDDLGAVWSYVAYASAATFAVATPTRVGHARSNDQVYHSLPVFALLVSITVLLGTSTAHLSFSRGIAVAVLVSGMGLLLARQRTLQAQVAERTRELQRANDERNSLIENLAHDLRTPLTALRGYLDHLNVKDESLSGPERGRFLGVAVRQAERLSRLVGELFELIRLDAPFAHLALEQFAPAEVVQDVVLEFASIADARAVSCAMELESDAESAQIVGDIGLFQRLVENLVDNAVRHTPAGGRVTVRLGADARDIALDVIDTGQGIPRQDLERIFNRYERGQSNSPESGAGLGLAIVHRIVQLHHGSISVESDAQRGTQFKVRMPRASMGASRSVRRPPSLPDAVISALDQRP